MSTTCCWSRCATALRCRDRAPCFGDTGNHPSTAELIRVAPAEWPRLAGFIVDCNRRADGGVHCLHARHGNDAASHCGRSWPRCRPTPPRFWALRDDGRLQAVIGCEFDHRCRLPRWVRGPLWERPARGRCPAEPGGPVARDGAADDPPLRRLCGARRALLNGSAGSARCRLCAVAGAHAAAGTDRVAAVRPGGRRRAAGDAVPTSRPPSALHQALFPSAYVSEADLVRGLQATGLRAPRRDRRRRPG
jgi:hypothetical protein